MQKYLSAKQVKETYHITSQTLHNWRLGGKIRFEKLPSGKLVYYPFDTNTSLDKCVIYARVSNTKQKDDLVRQISILRQFMGANGVIVDAEYSDVASGMNETRPGFTKLIEACATGTIKQIYITYKDRLTRFGFDYIKKMCALWGVEIIVINATTEQDFQQELTQDLVSIIHHFSMRMYSNRRKLLKEMSEEISKDINTNT